MGEKVSRKKIAELMKDAEAISKARSLKEWDIEIGEEVEEDYVSQSHTEDITFIELAMINAYMHSVYRNKSKDIKVKSYGTTDNLGRINYGGLFDGIGSFWFSTSIKGEDNDFIIQTKSFVDTRGELVTQLNISAKNGLIQSKFAELAKKILSLTFNSSEYKGKCIKVKLREGHFKGIEVIDVQTSNTELVLNKTQNRYIKHFISRVSRGGNARYLFNGEPGTGKTESIREITRRLIPNVTFIIPEFTTTDDLTAIMEACEIFENSVIIMDDIDLYLGSRENGSYTRLLGQFLSFFDGIKKRKLSLLASTNDKGLVDKAAERPGRFNLTLDFGFLDDEQIVKVCNIHLPKEYRIKEVYEALKGNINGKKVNITGAFISNLADNIKEMSEDDAKWSIDDTISLIKESYRGFYSSQVEKERQAMGFNSKQ
jgi:hypothetical protein